MITTDLSVLKKVSRETTIVECASTQVFEQLKQALANSSVPGRGLAAIQIGIDIRACVVRIYPNENVGYVELCMINPKIIKQEQPMIFANEMCLSMPGISVMTDRYNKIECEWVDYNTTEQKKETFTGITSVCIQQEVDHCSGILITDRKHNYTKIGRNEPCYCNSGKKFKKCHGV